MGYEITSELHKAFLSQLRTHRQELGLTMTEVADRLGIAYGSYAQIEHGRRTPTLEVVERVIGALGLKVELKISERPSRRRAS